MSEESVDSTDRFRVGHFFADVGGESEPLSAYGDVYRFGLDPRDSPFTAETYAVDLSETVPDVDSFDLGLFHPPCYKWTQRDDETAENLIPRSREIAAELCDEYIIENQPDAPLEAPDKGTKVVLHGSMFNLPVCYERAFELSYEVPRPRRPNNWSAEHRVEYTRPKRYWKAVKGLTGDYPGQELATNITPAPYIHYLVRPMLDGYQHRPSSQTRLVTATEGGNSRCVEPDTDHEEGDR